MGKRRKAREVALEALYCYEIRGDTDISEIFPYCRDMHKLDQDSADFSGIDGTRNLFIAPEKNSRESGKTRRGDSRAHQELGHEQAGNRRQEHNSPGTGRALLFSGYSEKGVDR